MEQHQLVTKVPGDCFRGVPVTIPAVLSLLLEPQAFNMEYFILVLLTICFIFLNLGKFLSFI